MPTSGTGCAPSEPLSAAGVVTMAGALPDIVLKDSDTWTNITFQGKGFAWVNHAEDTAMIKARHDEREALLATAPDVYEPAWSSKSSAWVRVRLPLAQPDEVFELLEEGWRMTASKRAVAAYDESRAR